MKIVCLDADTLGNDVDLDAVFGKFGEFVSYNMTEANQTVQRLQNADIVLTNKVLITKDVIAQTNLKLICVTATGVNNIDLEAAKEANIPVKNVAGYSTNSVAQQTFANILALRNSTSYYENYGKNSDGWAKSPIFVNLDRPIFELSGKRFCVVGLGTIGLEIAKIAQAFGCDVCYYSTSGNNSNSEFKRVSFKEALQCDIISIHAPLNENTKNLFDANALNQLKDGAMLVNSGRGGIIDEEKIAQIIDEREIYFATDVLEKEPIRADHPLLKVKNKDRLMITPHIAWASVEARKKLIELSAKNIEDFIKG
ncbi:MULTISPECIES: D-2-hydroxyacid dehydrogenase [Campylobacter]|uniref:D-2-hydroxyacid dehydrogenase n=1 Tax=Campylobacter vicugnae TaxID=1660076 RepID=A0ABZ2E721_9BACT|nr:MULTISPECIES: D-2-hydroxyacid dehydrogenase [unclassified Campylobacter]ARR04502.1 2-hydroxyacid dehydrogenase [Campylobacter sp. RM12175]MCR8689797.1 D-2-hydroxyacid dehydrogenase [Campylobacter sp. RM9264]MCR8701261.1 D-2-hydroxyacid dehydrogenase [Campylobacter sp. RM12176]